MLVSSIKGLKRVHLALWWCEPVVLTGRAVRGLLRSKTVTNPV